MFKIITYDPKCKTDMHHCFLSAREAIEPETTPKLREDLLDIQKHYFDKGDTFWLAINEEGRVIGMLGTNTISATDMWLKRLYIKPCMKRKGIASALLATAEDYAKAKGIKTIHTRFKDSYTEAAHFYPAKGFIEAERIDSLRHLIKKVI